ncbi:glutamate mutase L [soil metagenome]
MVTHRNADAPTGLEQNAVGGARELIDAGTSLVIDIDENLVRGVVFDSVEGQARFVASAQAPSTLGAPISDPSVGVREVVSILEQQTGFELTSEGDEGSHLGPFAITGYPVKALTVAIVPTGRHVLTKMLAATGRATPSSVYLLTDSVRTEDGVLSSTLLESRVRSIRPDIVVLLEGDRAQSEWASAVGTFGMLFQDQTVDQIIVLASDEFQQYIIQALGEGANLTGLDPAQYENSEVAMALETELSDMYEQRVGASPRMGLNRDLKFVSRLRASDLATRFIARRIERNVVAVDVSAGTVINWSTMHSGGSAARPDLDVHKNVRSLLSVNFEALRTVVPIEMSQEDLANWVLNRAVRPRSVSALKQDQVVESVLLSQVVATAWRDLEEVASDQIDVIIAGPGFCLDADPALGVMAVLNGIQPAPLSGVVQVVLDPDGLLWAAGAIGDVAPALAADVIENDVLTPAATVVVVEGSGTEAQTAVAGKLTYEDGESVKFDVPYGSMFRLPLGDDDQATLVLTCEPGFAVGASNPGEQLHIGPDDGLQGGEVGVIIDARGRPMSTPVDDGATGRAFVRRWYTDLGIEL